MYLKCNNAVFFHENTVPIILSCKNTDNSHGIIQKYRTSILGSRENTTLGGLYFPSTPKSQVLYLQYVIVHESVSKFDTITITSKFKNYVAFSVDVDFVS